MMRSEEQARFADDIRRFSPGDIDRLHRVLIHLQEDETPFTPTAVRREYSAICQEDRHQTSAGDDCLRWLLDLLDADPEAPLNEKFLDVLQEAHIVLTTDGTTTDGGTEYEAAGQGRTGGGGFHPLERPDQPESIASLDESDTLWQQAVALDNRKLASQALEQWRYKLHVHRDAYLDHEDPVMNHVADTLYLRNLGKKALSHWANVTRDIQDMERAAQEHRARRDASFVLKQWTLAGRGNLLTRIRDERLLGKVLGTWRGKTAAIKDMEATADDFRDWQAARNTLAIMRAKKSQVKHHANLAVVVYEGNLVRKLYANWLTQLDQIRFNERRAEAAADYFASKHTLQKWRDKTRLALQEKEMIEARQHMLAFKAIRKWQEFMRKTKNAKYAEAYKTMRRKVKVNIARAALENWRVKATRIREMKLTADEFRARKEVEHARRMAHDAIVTMYTRTQLMQEANQQADLVSKRQLVERLQIFGSSWLAPTRQILDKQKRADEYRATRTASYAVSALRNWRNLAFRARRLDEDADVVLQRNEKKRALALLQKWRRSVAQEDQEEERRGREERLVPVTPAARRSQLLASTTPAYTPGVLFSRVRLVEEENDED